MSRSAIQSNFQDHLQWFQNEFVASAGNRQSDVELAPPDMKYSFPSSIEIIRPMIQLGSFSMEELGKFMDGKPRSLHVPTKTFQPLPEPKPRVTINTAPVPKPVTAQQTNNIPSAYSSAAPSIVTSTFTAAPPTLSSSTTQSFSAATNHFHQDMSDAVVEDSDLERIALEIEAAAFAEMNKPSKTMSDMLGVTTTASTYNSHTLATPKPTFTNPTISNSSHSKSNQYPVATASSSSYTPMNAVYENVPSHHPLVNTTAKVVKRCHCNTECDIVTIVTSQVSKRSYLCRRLICSFLEWVDEGSFNNSVSKPTMSTPYLPGNTSYNNNNNNNYTTSHYTNNATSTVIGDTSSNYVTPYHGADTSIGGGDDYSNAVDTSVARNSNFAAANNSASNYNNSSDYNNTYSSNNYNNTSTYDGSSHSNNANQYPISNYNSTDYNYNNNSITNSTYDNNSNYSSSNNNNNNNNYNYHNNGSPAVASIKPLRNPRIEVQKRFGHREFRPGQWDCIEAALQNRDVFCLMPTGGGKSMVYQLPAWCCAGVTVVFSPLISLIQDQVDALNAMGIRAVCLSQASAGQDYETSEGRMLLQELRSYRSYSHSVPIESLPPAEQTRIQKEDEQRIKMLYVTPEKFSRSPAIRSLLQQLMHNQLLSRFVLDEAHCLSQWGHDFRPDYLRLTEIRTLCPSVPIMALTATANQSVVQDIIKILQMQRSFVHTQSFNRPNLQYKVLQKKGEKPTLEEIANYIVAHAQWTGIIYCLSRKDCETLVDDLVALKPQLRGKISFYHADLPAQEKEFRQRQWFKGDFRVLCATIAFGMGINKPDVRYVIHLHMPKSLTNYYQESGRAGRDGLNAECILYYSYKDKSRVLSMLDKSQASADGQQRQLTSLMKCLDFCLDEVTCRRQLILSYFGETFDSNLCKNTCDTCQAMAVLRQNFVINGIPLQRLVETHDVTHIATLAVHLVMVTTSNENYNGNNSNNNGKYGGYNNSRNNNNNGSRLPKLTASKLAKLLSGSKGKEVNLYLASLNQLKENLQPNFQEQDINNIHTQYSKEAMEIICHRFIIDGFLREEHVVTNMQGNYGADYLVLGQRARELLDNHGNSNNSSNKGKVYVKFRGQMPTNGYGANTGITNSIAAKSGSKKNNSKSSHSNIVQANGSLGTAYAQHHVDEILVDDDDNDDFVDHAYNGDNSNTSNTTRPAGSHSNSSYNNANNNYNNVTTTTAANSRKRKSPPTVPAVEAAKKKKTYSDYNRNLGNNYASDLDSDPFEDAPTAKTTTTTNAKTNKSSKNVPANHATAKNTRLYHPRYNDDNDDEEPLEQELQQEEDEDDWGADSDDSAANLAMRYNTHKTKSATHTAKTTKTTKTTADYNSNANNRTTVAATVVPKRKHLAAADAVVDLLEDSDAEDVALDPVVVAEQRARRRAAQQAKAQQWKQEQRLLRTNNNNNNNNNNANKVNNTISATSKSNEFEYDFEDNIDDNVNNNQTNSLNNSYVMSSGDPEHHDQQDLNLSTMSTGGAGLPTKRALHFSGQEYDDNNIHTDHAESGRVRGEEDEDEEAEFDGQPSSSYPKPSTSQKPAARKSLLLVPSSEKKKQSKLKKKTFKTFLDRDDSDNDDEDGDFIDNDDEEDELVSDSGAGNEDDDEDEDDIADLALHAFPRRTSNSGMYKSSAKKLPLFSGTQSKEKMPFKLPYLTQRDKQRQEQEAAHAARLAEEKRLVTIGSNGLNGRQQDALRLWLQAYRRRWANYWHHLSDASLDYIVTQSLPQSIDDVADVPGIGESRAARDGPELLATLGAFLQAEQAACSATDNVDDTAETSESVRLQTAFASLLSAMPPAGVVEDIIWRDPQSEAAQLKMSGVTMNNMNTATAINTTTAAQNRLSFPIHTNNNSTATTSGAVDSANLSRFFVPPVAIPTSATKAATVNNTIEQNNNSNVGHEEEEEDLSMLVDDDFLP